MGKYLGNTKVPWFEKTGFAWAAGGAALGLGALWKLPFFIYQYQGGIYVLIFLICCVFVTLPVMVSEVFIGRSTQSNIIDAFTKLNRSSWNFIGLSIGITLLLLLGWFGVMASWFYIYLGESLLAIVKPDHQFSSLQQISSSFLPQFLGIIFFFGISSFIVSKGFRHGIKNAVRILFWVVTALMGILVIGILSGSQIGFLTALGMVITPKVGSIMKEEFIQIFGHSLNVLMIGSGVLLSLGTYLEKEAGVSKITIKTGVSILLACLLGCFIVFPLIVELQFHDGTIKMDETALFSALPTALITLPMGNFLVIIYYLIFCLLSLFFGISVLHALVESFSGKIGFHRKKTTFLATGSLVLLSVIIMMGAGLKISIPEVSQEYKLISSSTLKSEYNLNNWEFTRLAVKDKLFGKRYFQKLSIAARDYKKYQFLESPQAEGIAVKYTIPHSSGSLFHLIEYILTRWMLPINTLLLTFFIGWALPQSIKRFEFAKGELYYSKLFNVWNMIIKYIAPVLILCYLLFA